ncbi:MAG TPA: ATP-dependent protease subunit HslV [Thermosulfidibacter takaii]|uniref:ATP-dependent protease subunit HslV n=1 Tax=Thermosulfidibacter takaii TaxID=412593 RepID=A0A7C0U711_9BACT|nr:ATP-dependent protease subunit HslV [Thermosulfidibacter takaii]
MRELKGTTIVAVRKGNKVAVAGDGQVTLGTTVIKAKAKKVRKIFQDRVIVGFAGASADALTLLVRLEEKLQGYGGNLARAAVELAKDWRTDRTLRRLEAFIIAADQEKSFLISGTGDVIEPDDGVMAIGSGGPYALAAARALITHTQMSPREIALEALRIASSICVYTNREVVVEEL